MRILPFLILIVAISPAALAAISVYQNDAGTGGDGGTWEAHPAPLNNRHGGVSGAYNGELYHFIDEVDWYSFVLPAGTTDLKLSFAAQSDGVCFTLNDGAVFTATLIDPSGARIARADVNPCYGADSTRVASPVAGKWVVSFALDHADPTRVDAGTGPVPASVPDSTAGHLRYAFALACQPGC